MRRLHLSSPSGFETALQAEALCERFVRKELVVPQDSELWQQNPDRRCSHCQRIAERHGIWRVRKVAKLRIAELKRKNAKVKESRRESNHLG